MEVPRLSKPYRWSALFLALTVLALFLAFSAYDNTVGTWRRLRAVANQVEGPGGYFLLDREEFGTTWCFISCSEATILIRLGGEGPVQADTCERLVKHLERVFNRARTKPLGEDYGQCGQLPLTEVQEESYLQVSNPSSVCPTRAGHCFEVRVSSGID